MSNNAFKCQKYGQSANECKNEQRCLQCSGQHRVKQCTEPKEKAKCAHRGGSHASVYKGCFSYQNSVVVTKRKQDIKYSAVAKRQSELLHPNSTVSAINRFVLFAEVLSKIRSTFNTMCYSDKIIVVSASRIFGDKIEGQKVHDRIKNANNIFTNILMRQISTNSHQCSQHR